MQKHNEHGDNMNIPPQTMLILICDIKQLDILYKKKIEFEITSEPKF